jgi:hypothetical protein
MNHFQKLTLFIIVLFCLRTTIYSQTSFNIDVPDRLVSEAYEKAAVQNVLAAVNPKIFYGYFSVCADGIGFGYGYTYPSLDGHQMSDALLWLGQLDVVKANWEYVKKFQKSNGELPIGIFPDMPGKIFGPPGFQSQVDSNGGLYKHWVPGQPLRALAGTTYIQNADVIFRYSQDKAWLNSNLSSINLSGDQLASLVTPQGAVGGAGYYLERPVRIEFDGVSQCHAVDAFDRLSALNAVAGNTAAEEKYRNLARLIEHHFRTRFWLKDRFIEYIHPERGLIYSHGLTDVDWSAVALKTASPEQLKLVWPQLKKEPKFYYSGMPTGIATFPENYEKWESTYGDNQDLAAMGRVWYIEAQARYNMNDAEGLLETIKRVCKAGKDSGYYWRERYNEKGGYGAEKYNEYPANLIRIVQRFLLGIDLDVDGAVCIKPVAPESYWKKGFGQTLSWHNSNLSFTINSKGIKGNFSGSSPQTLAVRLQTSAKGKKFKAWVNGKSAPLKIVDDCIRIVLPKNQKGMSVPFRIYEL